MNAGEFSNQFQSLPTNQRSTALYYFLGAVAFHATDTRGTVTQQDLHECAAAAVEFAKASYPEEKSA